MIIMASPEERALVSRGLWVLQFRAAKIAMPLVGHVTTGTSGAREHPGRADETAH